jgi:hypothetical protein
MENKQPHSNSVFHDSPIKKNLTDYKYDTVYFGTPHKQSMTMKLDDVLFLTPLKGIASIFAARPQSTRKYIINPPHELHVNRDFKEWSKNSTDYLKEVHVLLRGIGMDIEVKDTVEDATGYVYELKLTPELKKHIWWGNKMQSPDFEVVLKDVKEITFDNEKKLDIKMYVSKDPRQPIPVNESYIPDATTGTSDFDEKDDDPDDCFCESATDKDLNCISYAMGVDDSIYDLKKDGFEITEDDGDYKVRFNSDKASIWEKYITDHIQDTYWNEYINLDDHEINFMIKENGQIERYINSGFNENPKLLAICNRLCEGDFKTMKDLLLSNDFYKSYIKDWDKNINEGCDNMPLSEFDHFFQEAKMKSKTRKELDDSDFALVYKDASGNKVRKYPINDEAHVKAAARMFPRGVPNKYRKEVAGKILRRAHKFGIDTEGWKSLNNAVKD